MITKDQALTAIVFRHISAKDSRGNPVQCRRSGRTQTWKTRPVDFKVPVKYGLYESFYITQGNASLWEVA